MEDLIGENQTFIFLKILFVNSEDLEINFFKKITDQMNHKIMIAKSQDEALEIITQEKKASSPIDLIIFDLKQSEINGLVVMKKALDVFPGIKTCVLTNTGIPDLMNTLKKEKLFPDGILHKAEPKVKLLNFIDMMMEQKIQNSLL